eukprot:gene44776-17938_t
MRAAHRAWRGAPVRTARTRAEGVGHEAVSLRTARGTHGSEGRACGSAAACIIAWMVVVHGGTQRVWRAAVPTVGSCGTGSAADAIQVDRPASVRRKAAKGRRRFLLREPSARAGAIVGTELGGSRWAAEVVRRG